MNCQAFRLSLLIAAATIPVFVASSSVAQEPNRTALTLEIPRQDLAVSLRQLATQSQTTIVVDDRRVAGMQAPRLKGRYTVAVALTILLRGTGLVAQNVDGGYAIGESGALSEDDPDDGQAILVTGSRARGTVIPSAVIRISRDTILDTGQSNLGDVVRRLPQSFGGGQNPGIGSNVPEGSGVDVGGASSINLRGLGSDATLTLLNGHRLSYTAVNQSVDVSGIPVSALERIEMVPDGASAIYGSDAVAGVANVILRRDFDGLETSARLSGTTDGGGFQQQYGGIAGQIWSGGGLYAAYEYGSNSAIRAAQRTYAARQTPGLDLYPAMRHHSFVASAHQQVLDNLTFELDGLYNVRWSENTFPTLPGGNLDAGRSTFSSKDVSFGIAPTLKWELAPGLRMALSGTYGKERVDYHQVRCTGTVCTDSGNMFYRNTARSLELGIDGDVFALPGGTSTFAAGAGYRGITFERFSGVGGAANTTASQDSYYAYAELALPLIGPAQELGLVHRLDGSAAIRYEQYPGIGDVLTPKLGLAWAPSRDVTLKGSWGKSFRAPTLYQQYQPDVVYLYSASLLGAAGASATDAALLILGGSPELKPERATTWSTSVELHPVAIEGAKLEIGYFDVDYRDRIVTPITQLTQSLSNPIYSGQITRDPAENVQTRLIANAATYVNVTGVPHDPQNVIAIVNNSRINAGRSRARGVDLLGQYTLKVSSNQSIDFTANVAWLQSDRQLSSTQPVIALAGTIFNPPQWRGTGGVAWTDGATSVSANASYIGAIRDSRYNLVVRLDPMTTVDLTARHRFGATGSDDAGTVVTLSVQNLFNAKPQSIRTLYASDTPYDSTNYSPFGRILALGVTKAW